MHLINTDYLIVGQGLAGTMLAYFLRKGGAEVFVLDNHQEGCASAVAAGLISPITGRRFVKSWSIDTLLPFARHTYKEMEMEFGFPFFHEREIFRVLFSIKEDNDWQARAKDPEYIPYMGTKDLSDIYADQCSPFFGHGQIRNSAQVDTAKVLRAFREKALDAGWMRLERFKHDALQFGKGRVQYQDITATKVVFCEGIGIEQNPFFQGLPVEGAKGEVLIIRIPDFPAQWILKHKIFLAPLGEDLFWAGSTYDWGYPHAAPTEAVKSVLLERVHEILRVPFEVVDHRAGVRPTIQDRRPLLGFHAVHPELALFNGMGTKGASLAPYWAAHFAEVLLQAKPLDKEVDLQRYAHTPFR